MHYYDFEKKQLVHCRKTASPDFWDSHWRSESFAQAIKTRNHFVSKETGRFLPLGSRILEGGCGRGQNVYSLQAVGFDAYGIDFAPKTIELITKYAPELKIIEGDVRRLPFENEFFDAYWSLGVIEHFYNGYDEIISEMSRVLRKGGYLFVTFPYMNMLRKIKSVFNVYPILPENFNPVQSSFYQFCLNTDSVIRDFNNAGFRLVKKMGMDGIKGVKDEIGVVLVKSVLQRLYDSKIFFARVMKRLLDYPLSVGCGHSIFIVFQKML